MIILDSAILNIHVFDGQLKKHLAEYGFLHDSSFIIVYLQVNVNITDLQLGPYMYC